MENLIATNLIKEGERVTFIDLKVTKGGKKHLLISQLLKNAAGEPVRKAIQIFDLDVFFKVMEEMKSKN